MKTKHNKTSFQLGHTRSQESIEKQRETMRRNYALGLRKPPLPRWTEESKARMVESNRKICLKKIPIGTTKEIQNSKNIRYRMVKTADRGRWEYEHRVVMSQKLGRPLHRDEHVHHRNKDTLDNRPENLELLTHSKHSAIHVRDRTKGAVSTSCHLKPGQWSLRHIECTECGTTSIKHAAKGVCKICYAKMWHKKH